MEDVTSKLQVMDVQSHSNRIRILNFLNVVDNLKLKKKALQILESMKDVKADDWDHYIQSKLRENDINFLKTVSVLLEISPTTCTVMERNYEMLVHYMRTILEHLCAEEIKSTMLDSESFSVVSALAAKVCLQLMQFFPKKIKDLLFSTSNNQGVQGQVRDNFQGVIQSLLTILCKKGFPKDASLLSGTALALLINLDETNNSKRIADEVVGLLQMLAWSDDSVKECSILNATFNLPMQITSVYSQISLIHGLVTIGAEVLLLWDSKGELVLKKLLDIILNSCLQVPDANAKYVCFKTIFSWLTFLSDRNRLDIVLGNCKSQEFFIGTESQFMKPLLALVKNHVEDLVDGVSQYTQKIFRTLLLLQTKEHSIGPQENHSPKKFVDELASSINQQGWFMKGRWMLFSEIIPYLGVDELLKNREEIANDLMKCLTTCSLPAISNEVYIAILKELKKSQIGEEKLKQQWSLIFSQVIIAALLSDTLLLRQNVGQYWLPSTFRILPECIDLLESTLLDEMQSKHFLHSQIIIIKTAWNLGLLSSEELGKRSDLLEQASRCIDLDVRIETFNVICSNAKKTEPLLTFLQGIILDYLRNNLNCDSPKFRQQMFAALKRLLLNVRDSSIMLHRHVSKTGKVKIVDSGNVERLNGLIEFVEEIIAISRSCLSPASSFQRKKTGLQLVEMLSDLFVYAKDVKKRRKGAATESFLDLLEYIRVCYKNDGKWRILSSMDTELLSCMEDQHDEIREIAIRILLYQQSLLPREQELLSDYVTFAKLMTVALNLLNSPRFHEVESGGCYIYYLANRLTENPLLTHHLKHNLSMETDESNGLQILLNILMRNAEEALSEAPNDFLLASTKRPIYGYAIAISQVLRHISESPDILPTDFNSCLHRLLAHCSIVTSVMVNLLAGTFVAVNGKVGKEESEVSASLADTLTDNSTSLADASPTFADIDQALDIILKSSPSYVSFAESITHMHCCELLLSFCWLNLKSTSFVITELGNAFNATRRNAFTLDTASMGTIQNFFKLTLVCCRHKGVIENSHASLMKFAKAVSFVPTLWKVVGEWCSGVLLSSTDLSEKSSVTKRSAGIPMYVQSILSAEPATENHDLLHSTMKHLFNVASTKLPDNITATYDLPQFNAINILRSIFRDTTLGNAVLRYVEDALILTMDGFSSPSWSIRNASTQLLGTLVPRMLGQRLSQEEMSQQNMSTVDVFFYRYPKLLPFLEDCLRQQKDMSRLAISRRIIPVVTFLSKLRPSENEELIRISERYLPYLQQLRDSEVYIIRDLTVRAILAFTPLSLHHQIIEEHFQDLKKDELPMTKSPNLLHSSTLMLLKILTCTEHNLMDHSRCIVNNFLKEDAKKTIPGIDYITRSLVIDILVKAFTTLKDQSSASCLLNYVLGALLSLKRNERPIDVGRVFLVKALSKAVTILLLHAINVLSDTETTDLLVGFSEWPNNSDRVYKDFTEKLFQEVLFSLKDLPPKANAIFWNLITRSISDMQNIPQISADVLSCYLVMLESTDAPCEVVVRTLVSLLQRNRYPPILLPCVSKTLSREILRNGFSNGFTEKDIDTVSEAFCKNSAPENDENFRFAVAQSLTVLENFLYFKSNKKDKIVTQRQQKVLHRFFWASLNLLQDEDDEIRTEATRSLQFLNQDYNQERSLQCNITMKNFFHMHKSFPGHKVVFVLWLVDVLCAEQCAAIDGDRDLMLFEQEAANLFAEEFAVTDIAINSLKDLISTVSSTQHEHDNDGFNEHNQLLGHIQSKIFDKSKKIYNSIKQMEERSYNQSRRSVLGLFRNRKNFNRLYKFTKLLHFLLHLNYETFLLKEEFQGVGKWLSPFENHPLLSQNVQEVKQYIN